MREFNNVWNKAMENPEELLAELKSLNITQLRKIIKDNHLELQNYTKRLKTVDELSEYIVERSVANMTSATII